MDQDSVQTLDFFSLWNVGWFVVVVLLAVLYLAAVGSLRKHFSDSEPVKAHKKVYFFCGLMALFGAKGTPLAAGAEYVFSFHMLTMAIEYLLVPPLLLAGLPDWLIRPLFQQKWFKKGISFFIRPLIALVLFNFLFSVYHMPAIFDTVMGSETLHVLYMMALTFTAFCMWWVVVSPLPELKQLSHVKKMGFVFANGVLLTPACALIMFSRSLLYETYMNNTTLFEYLPPLEDQQFGGVAMKVGQEIIFIGALGYIFYQWIKKIKSKEDEDEYEISESARMNFAVAGNENKI
jgi:putative membrane protein